MAGSLDLLHQRSRSIQEVVAAREFEHEILVSSRKLLARASLKTPLVYTYARANSPRSGVSARNVEGILSHPMHAMRTRKHKASNRKARIHPGNTPPACLL
jgi:hypothetical protein